jgi:hypothetical protein
VAQRDRPRGRLVERRRKVAPAAFFWSLVLGFAVGHRRRIASLRRFYRATTGTALVPSSFYDWTSASSKWQLFERIRENDGFFVSRLRDDVSPVIVEARWAC